jgi:hypothetical protein
MIRAAACDLTRCRHRLLGLGIYVAPNLVATSALPLYAFLPDTLRHRLHLASHNDLPNGVRYVAL